MSDVPHPAQAREAGHLILGYTEDGKPFHEGHRLFNYYDMAAGVVTQYESDGWFCFVQEDGQMRVLNHERVCTIDFARRKGWL